MFVLANVQIVKNVHHAKIINLNRKMNSKNFFHKNLRVSSIIFPVYLLFISICNPVFAHHPFGMGESSSLTSWQGFISGIGHPLLGPDHLLFILAISLIGLRFPKKWILPLLGFGLIGSAVAQIFSLPEFMIPYAEALVSLSLVVESLIILGYLPSALLLPMISLHGYLIGGAIVGAEQSPLLSYFLGIFIGQGSLLLIVLYLSEHIGKIFKNKNLVSGILIGIGAAFSWVALID